MKYGSAGMRAFSALISCLSMVVLPVMTPVAFGAQPWDLSDLEKTLAEKKPAPLSATVVLDAAKDGHFSACGQTIRSLDVLPSMLEKGTETKILFRADRSLDYKAVMSVMERLRDLGFLNIGLAMADADPETALPPSVKQIKACRDR